MGQSSSKSPRPTSGNAEASTSSHPDAEFGATSGPSTSTAPTAIPNSSRSRRPSLRKRVVSLIKPGSGKSREQGVGSSSAVVEGEKRKSSWRNSRRWSKSPLPPPDFHPSQPAVLEDVERPSSPQASSSGQPSTPSIPLSDKGKSREEEEVEDPEADVVSPPSERTLTPYPSMPEVIPADSRPPPVPEPVPEPPSTSAPDPAPEPEPSPPTAPTATTSTAPPARQFPPPGTLVVVQGIVHTTDVSRPPPNDQPSGLEASSNSTRGSGIDSSSTTTETSSTSRSDSNIPASTSHSAISPGSIDVLGTLLSVAAAATAASLLTGSTDPIVTSGLAPSAEPSSSNPTTSTPSSPTSTGALVPSSPAYGPADTTYAASRAERMRQAWGTIRQRLGLRPTPPASQPSLGADGLATRAQANAEQQITDTRELMLAEMARAFNIGLGLNGMAATNNNPPASGNAGEDIGRGRQVLGLEGEVSGAASAAGGEAAAAVPPARLPPAGSFDRFLVDLQADLRVALTGEEQEGEERSRDGEGPTEEGLQRVESQVPPAPSTPPPPLPPSPAPAPAPVEGEAPGPAPAPPGDTSVSGSSEEASSSSPVPEEPEREEVLPDLTDAQPNVEEAPASTTSPETAATAAAPTTAGPETEEGVTPSTSTNTMASGSSERMDANGRINWWRLYRFPAVNSSVRPSPSPSTSSTTTTTTSSGESSAPNAPVEQQQQQQTAAGAAPPPNTRPVTTTTPASGTNANANEGAAPPFLPNFLPPPSGQTVVPVIVVGLQSVDPEQFGFEHPHAHAPHPHPHPHPHHHHHPHSPFGVPQNNTDHTNNGRGQNAFARHGPAAAAPTGGPGRPRAVVDEAARTFQEELELMEALLQRVERDRMETELEDMARREARMERERVLDLPVWDEEEEEEDDEEEADGDEDGEVDTIRGRRESADGAGAGPSTSAVSASRRARVEDEDDDAEQLRHPRELSRDITDDNSDLSDDDDADDDDDAPTDRPEMYLGLAGRRHDRNARARALARAEAREERQRRRERRRAEEAAARARMAAEVEAARARRAASAAAAAAASAAEAAERRRAGATRGGVTMGVTAAAEGDGAATPVPGGARTFLIYVIGGYYPPDHSIVTGGPESFESFEALLELAEMLGHAKPPTVTKEEIEKSGLETIKPALLAEYEEAGKIASNCTERCLICLDDYDPEDDIRVMKCRHAFHQGCVDKWMQTGRNNCPACRSTGVPTGDNAMAPATTPTSTPAPRASAAGAVPTTLEAVD